MAKKLFVLEGQISFKCRLLNMGKNIIFKNQKNHSLEKMQSPKNCKNGKKWLVVFVLEGRFFTLFHNFLKITSEYAQKHIKKSEKIIHQTNFQVRKNSENDQKWQFFDTVGPNFDPFLTNFCKSLLNMPKNMILKNKKIAP